VASESAVVTVKALPTQGRPADFSGLVGRFAIKASLTAPTANVGDNVTLTLVVEGDGMIDRLGDVRPLLPNGFKSYSDKPAVERAITTEGRLTGRKTFKFALVPVDPGAYTIAEQKLSVFDTAAGAYVTLKTDSLSLQVTGNAAAVGPAGTGMAEGDRVMVKKAAVKSLGTDLLPMKPLTRLTSRRLPSMLEWLVMGVLLLVMPLVWMGILMHDRWGGGLAGRDRRRLERGAVKRLRSEVSVLSGDVTSTVAGSALLAFRRYMAVKLGDGWLSYTAKEIHPKLVESGVPTETAEAVVTLVTQLESIEYGGSAGVMPGMTAGSLCDRLVSIARQIERSVS
jgi:hypothetical protein